MYKTSFAFIFQGHKNSPAGIFTQASVAPLSRECRLKAAPYDRPAGAIRYALKNKCEGSFVSERRAQDILRADSAAFSAWSRAEGAGEKAAVLGAAAGAARMSSPGCLEAGASSINQKGFGVIEIVVAVAIIGMVFFGIYQFAIVSATSVHASSRQIAAAYLAQEGIEIMRTKRNTSWDDSIATLGSGTTYYPRLVSNSWTLTTSNPGLIDTLFTRTVVLQDVLRDGDDNIASTGTIDPETRKVTVTVSWAEKTGPQEIVLETYITNFLQN